MFLRSPLAAWFHIKLPSKRTKCTLRQPNFSKFPRGGWTPLQTSASGARKIEPSELSRTPSPYKILPTGPQGALTIRL